MIELDEQYRAFLQEVVDSEIYKIGSKQHTRDHCHDIDEKRIWLIGLARALH